MSIIKLVADGPSVALTVVRVEDAKGQRDAPQWKFVGRTATDPDAAVFLAVESAERQVHRIGLDRATVVGRTLEFRKNDKGYIDVMLAAGTSGPPMAAAPTTAPALAGDELKAETKRRLALYEWCVEHVTKKTMLKLVAANIAPSHEGVALMAATLYDTLQGLDA